MDFRQLDDNVAVAAQITPADVSKIAEAGFRSIICNRPDSEEGAYPHDEVEAAATAAGLEFHFLPVVSGQITEANVRDMASTLESAAKPTLAYCRSGTRCTNLYSLVSQLA
ncbi:MAG: TIGR01244 family sulfur transferase [Rhizobiaceae bacterium]